MWFRPCIIRVDSTSSNPWPDDYGSTCINTLCVYIGHCWHWMIMASEYVSVHLTLPYHVATGVHSAVWESQLSSRCSNCWVFLWQGEGSAVSTRDQGTASEHMQTSSVAGFALCTWLSVAKYCKILVILSPHLHFPHTSTFPTPLHSSHLHPHYSHIHTAIPPHFPRPHSSQRHAPHSPSIL